MKMNIVLSGKRKVIAKFDEFHVMTDQPVEEGGGGSAPSPFELFLASIGTCAGFFVQSFCQARSISTENIEVALESERDPATHLVSKIRLGIAVPPSFPEKYRPGLVAAVNQCTVKKHLQHPPDIEVMTSVRGAEEAKPLPKTAS